MRTRSRTLYQSSNLYSFDESIFWTNHPEWNSSSQDRGGSTSQFVVESSTISDEVGPISRRSGLLSPRECHHVRTKLRPSGPILWAGERTADPGSMVNERTYKRTETHPDVFSFLRRLGYTESAASDVLSDTDALCNYSVGDYIETDWFALLDSYKEACDQFIPASFLVGEDIGQPDIFIDAIKAVINPTRAVRTFIGLARSKLSRARYRKMNLRQVGHALAKDTANANLFYQFGVKPAIDDIGRTIDAHKRVSLRLAFLRHNAGRFVPVHVRRTHTSAGENFAVPVPSGGGQLFYHLVSKSATFGISSHARVREDLNWGSTWQAYLQYFGINKVVGLAWELVPFSFVVDWFTNAQERINYYTRLNTGGPFTEFVGLCSFRKQELHDSLRYAAGYDSATSLFETQPTSSVQLCERSQTDYTRWTRIPDTSGVVDMSALGLFHALVGGSLILQRG